MATHPNGSQIKEEFSQLGATVFGESWKHRLAMHLGTNLNGIERWADPRENRYPPEDVVAFLREQALAILDSRLVRNVSDMVSASRLHPSVASGLLLDLGSALKTQRKNATPHPKESSHPD